MKRFTLRYPGDPPQEVVRMDRRQFLEAYPRQPIGLVDMDSGCVISRIRMRPDQIECDCCDADPGDVVYVVGGRRGYCEPCFQKRLAQHCEEVE